MKEQIRQLLEDLFYEAMETPGEAYISTTLHKRDELNNDDENLLIGGDGWDDFESFFSWIYDDVLMDRFYTLGMAHEDRMEYVTEEQVEDELIDEISEWTVAHIEED